MESLGALGDGEWSSFNAIYSSTDEADFMAQLLGNCSLPNGLPNNSNVEFSSTYWPGTGSESDVIMAGVEESSINSSDGTTANNYYSFLQGSRYSGAGSSILFPLSTHQHIYYPSNINSHPILTRNDSSVSTDYDMVVGRKNTMYSSDYQMYTNNYLMEEDVSSDSMESGGNLKPEAVHEGMNLQQGKEHAANFLAPEKSIEDETDNLSGISKKRTRIPLHVQENKRMVTTKNKHEKLNSTDISIAEGGHPAFHPQSSSSCLSEDDSNASHEFNGGVLLVPTSCSNSKGASKALATNGKTRASRGSATDPQSLYARKRREKVNERLRILQNLVPNGTKVDISTMLEEAVQYVKFLQLQIKLLSSDDLWMYAPIAYNGMNLGLDLKIDATLKS